VFGEIQEQARRATQELLGIARPQPGRVLVVGCSTSEVMGKRIGTAGNVEIGRAVFEGVVEAASEFGVDVAAQCCEHLNRALVVEEEVADRFGWETVTVQPVPQAGGAFAASAMGSFRRPVVVERIQVHLGLDFGHTLIGMHLRPVAVPVRLSTERVGQAPVVAARTRPKLIGGARALYPGDQGRKDQK